MSTLGSLALTVGGSPAVQVEWATRVV
jgi:hypothetical protein